MTMPRRIALLLAAALLLMALGSLVLHGMLARQALRQQAELRNRDTAQALALALAPALAAQPADLAAARAVLETQFARGLDRSLRLRAADGRLLVDLQRGVQVGSAPPWFAVLWSVEAPPAQAAVLGAADTLGDLQVQGSTAWAQDALWDAATQSAAWLALLAIVAVGLTLWALRVWQAPLSATVAQAQALEHGRFVEAEEPALPELRALTRSMNATVRRLREVFAAQADQVALLQDRAQLDAVTGLAQRPHFIVRLTHRLAESGAPGAALLLVRVLELETLNPRLGHEATDRLLGAVADVLLTYVDRVPGAFAGRLNGSDFALCLPVSGVGLETAASLRTALAAAPALRNGGALVAVGGADGLLGVSCSAALAAADHALARAEAAAESGAGDGDAQTGGALWVETVSNAEIRTGARAWREQIAAALGEGRTRLAEFRVVDSEGRTLHLECPLRVQLQTGGEFQAADRWLALARRSRLMPEVDLVALDLALQAIARDGQPRAVHAATASMQSTAFVAEVTRRLLAQPTAAQRLSIERVEGPQPAGASEALARAATVWRPLGVRLGVEHAGAMPQALPALQEAGIDYIKVAARHLRGVALDGAVRSYAHSLVALIHGLGLEALAEGVDDAGDLTALWALGFDGATGPVVPVA
jgi:EAL domain-containing protein (putative c-di-GMP-specific phosphodiesterase class I)/GGDEF domain-containing protein